VKHRVKPDYSSGLAMTAAEKLFRCFSRLIAIRCLADSCSFPEVRPGRSRGSGPPSSFILVGISDDEKAAEQ
jgi:hypothetical protein